MEPTVAAIRRSVGEPGQFAVIYRERFTPLLERLLHRVWDSEIAVDLAAETIAEAFNQRRRFRGSTDAELIGWLNGIADRKLARFYRSHEIETRALQKLGMAAPVLSEESHRELMNRIDFGAFRQQLQDELGALSEPQRAALMLRVVEERSYADVAGRLGISEEAARARVARALGTLRNNTTIELMKEEFA
jgi:RNA polymerase sigma factor (sigma-70 family)